MNTKNRYSVKKLTFMAILLAIALIVFIIESLIPIPIPVPGAKLGLANAVTLFALFFANYSVRAHVVRPRAANDRPYNKHPYSWWSISIKNFDVFIILICRIILGAFFTGRLITFAFSLCGGLAAFFAMVIIKRFVNDKQIWVCGAIGAVFHNIGQICAAIVITGTPAIAVYLPVLIIIGIFTGVITGLVAQFTLLRITKV